MPPRKPVKHARPAKDAAPLMLTQPDEPLPTPVAAAAPDPAFVMTAGEELVLRSATLLLVYTLAFAARLFGAAKTEAPISAAAYAALFFGSNTALVAYQAGVEVTGERRTGLLAAALVAIAPGAVSASAVRSGGKDGAAGFAFFLGFLLLIKAVKAGSMLGTTGTALGVVGVAVALVQSSLPSGQTASNPATWATLLMDLHVVCFLMPVGVYCCVKGTLTAENIALVLYGIACIVCASVTLRLMVALAPVACLLSAVGVSEMLTTYCGQLKPEEALEPDQVSIRSSKKKVRVVELPMQREYAMMMVVGISLMLCLYVRHCGWVAAAGTLRPTN
jgi:asparagine N-glycosylation enzyme membrane subunit Stt3